MLERLRRPWQPIQRFSNGAAWFFIVVSLGHLAWVVATKWSNPAGLTTLYQTEVGGEVFRAIGMAYDGTGGLLLALAQAMVVSAAAVLSVLRWQRGRRLGHGVLVAWSGFWALNLLRLAMIDGQLDSILQTGVLFFLFACTVQRAAGGWSASRTSGGAPEQPERPDQPEQPLLDTPEPGSRVQRFIAMLKSVLHAAPRRARSAVRATRAGHGVRGRLASANRTAREKSAVALERAGDFAHRQARRLGPTS